MAIFKKKTVEKKVDENISEEYTKVKVFKTGFIKFLQHVCITTFAVCLFVVVTGSCITVPTFDGSVNTIMMSKTDEDRKYEDSVLFNTILGNELPNVIRLITISTQVETNGRYDSSKVIDLNDYVYRYNDGYCLYPELDAQYYLGDLLKWSKYGFDTVDCPYSKLSAAGRALAANESDGNPLIMLGGDEEDEEIYPMLTNRYKTVDGKTLEDIATNWAEYNELCNMLVKASSDLFANYSEYLKLSDYYDGNRSNIKYCVINGKGAKAPVYTNVDLKSSSVNAVTQAFHDYGRYIVYDSEKMIYDTNTAISEGLFNQFVIPYKYAFDEDGMILLAVDTSLPCADALAAGKEGYKNIFPYFSLLMCIIIISVICYLLLLLLGTIKEGRIRNTDGTIRIRQNSFDNSAIEIWLILTAIVIASAITVLMLALETEVFYFVKPEESYTRVAVGSIVFVFDIIALGLYYSLVRRIKGRNIWKPSMLHGICEWISRTSYAIYDNSSTIVRSVLPFTILIISNAVLVLAAFISHSLIPVFFLLILAIDISAGIVIYKQGVSRKKLIDGLNRIISGDLNYKAEDKNLHGDNLELATCVNSIGNSVRTAVEQSMKDEKMKTELVANVSHDIRTPLTSIINYVDLLKRENIQNENAQNYISVLDEKSQRLKQLTDDLIEASKVSSGNIELDMQKMTLGELVNQALGEFEDKFGEKNLSCVCRADNLTNGNIMADGKCLWRVMENLFVNIYKYAMPGTRVFLDMFNVYDGDCEKVVLQIKNMSATPLPANTSELTERFSRGDQSRSTEGSGLGLSIAKSLTEAMGGGFDLASEADLFKVELSFSSVK